MQKLGLIQKDKVSSSETCSAFDELFGQPLSQRQIIALAELFSKGIMSFDLESELLATRVEEVGV